jgi:RNA polymerase sigma factor (sigma-70 family)
MNGRTLHLGSEAADTPVVGGRVVEFEVFFDREKARLFRALCLVTRNRFEAEELTQDAFLSLYERWDRVGRMEDPTGYLYRTAMNAFRSWRRRSTLAARRVIGLIRSDDSIAWVDEQDAVVRALAPLSPRQRAAVVLIDLLGYTSEETSRILGISPSTVRTYVERAHRELRMRMDEPHE